MQNGISIFSIKFNPQEVWATLYFLTIFYLLIICLFGSLISKAIQKEIKNNENRVALTPAGVHSLVGRGHRVLVETNAGLGSGFADADYEKQGAEIVATAKEAWAAELVVKVKEPLDTEYQYLRDDLLLFTYLHIGCCS